MTYNTDCIYYKDKRCTNEVYFEGRKCVGAKTCPYATFSKDYYQRHLHAERHHNDYHCIKVKKL